MKKLLIIIFLMVMPFAVKAVECYSNGGNPATPNTNCTIDCTDPNRLLNNGQQRCGYVNQPNPNPSTDTCYDYYNPTYNSFFGPPNNVVVNNCKTLPAAPINSGLLFLIVAGLFLVTIVVYKNNPGGDSPQLT